MPRTFVPCATQITCAIRQLQSIQRASEACAVTLRLNRTPTVAQLDDLMVRTIQLGASATLATRHLHNACVFGDYQNKQQ